METLTALLRNSAHDYKDNIALQFKKDGEWKGISYREMLEKVDQIGLALFAAGLERSDKVAIFSPNRPEWAIADFAIQSVTAITIPIYATNTAAQVDYILKDANCKALFVGDRQQLNVIQSVIQNNDQLKLVVLFDDLSEEIDRIVDLKQFIKLEVSDTIKEEFRKNAGLRDTADVSTIIYTSGTTGDPKGVMLSNKNFFHQFMAFEANFDIDESDKSLCFLPLSHVYERMWSYMVFKFGATNYYIEDPKNILEYLKEVKPTVMVSVPRLYEKIYAAVMDKVSNAPFIRRLLFNWALKTGKSMADKVLSNEIPGKLLKMNHKLADKLVLKKLRDIVGGDKKFFSAGGAPLAKEIEEFFYSIGLLICQGYGLTESSPMISYNSPNAFRFGSVGKVVPGCEVKISDEGEILAKGDNITSGYYNNANATAEVLKNGWLHTGDIGHVDNDGYLHITDRMKDLIITSGGKNIAPQRIENMISKDFYIDQFVAIGDNKKFISGLLVPNFEAIRSLAKFKNIKDKDESVIVNDPEVIEFFKKQIEENTKELARYESVKTITLLAKPFTQEDGEMTPTLKIKRNVINKKYKDIIDKMYT